MTISKRKTTRKTSGGQTSSTYTPPVRPIIDKKTGAVISAGTPGSRVTSTTPENTTVISSQSSGSGGSGVSVALLILLMFVSWNAFWWPLVNSIWNRKNFSSSISPWIILGSILFIVGMEILASSSDEGRNLAWIMTAGLWIIFIMFNGSKQISETINKVTNAKPSKQSSSTAHLIQHTF